MEFTLLQVIFILISLVSSAIIPQGTSKDLVDNKISQDDPEFLTTKELTYLKEDPEVTHKVIFTISQRITPDESTKLGKLTIALFGKTVPKTVDNFFQLSTRTLKKSYQDVLFHRIIKRFMIQGGDISSEGGCSIYGESFNDENFNLKHDKLGRVSMANRGANTNSCQFFILNVEQLPHLDGKHVVFGQLIDGFDILEKISNVEVEKSSKPIKDIYISGIKTFSRDTEEMKEPLSEIEEAHKDQTSQEFGDQEAEAISELPRGYSYLVIVLLGVSILIGGLYYQLIHHRKKIIGIRQDKFF